MNKIKTNSTVAFATVLLCAATSASAQWTTSGTHIRNSNTGNVGINTSTTTPGKRLQVHSATTKDQFYVSGVSPTIYFGENISFSAANNRLGIITMATENNAVVTNSKPGDIILNSQTGKLSFVTGGSGFSLAMQRFSVGADKVTVGTYNDPHQLDVLGSATNCFKVRSGTDSIKVNGNSVESSSRLTFNSSSKKDIVFCPAGGNIGISTASFTPSARLEIYNNGGVPSLKLSGPTENMVLGSDEITTTNTSLAINASGQDVNICGGGSGKVSVGKFFPNSTFEIAGMENNGTEGTLKLITVDQTLILDGNEIDGLTSLRLNANSKKTVTLCEDGGSVGIGTANPSSSYKLSVNGGIRAKEVIVETGWSDFVFEKDYKLKSLQEVEKFINENGHLPEIPSAEEVAKEGVNLGEVESKLLMKIEELTLYIIKQDKRIAELESRSISK